jgi:hypothetical protein
MNLYNILFLGKTFKTEFFIFGGTLIYCLETNSSLPINFVCECSSAKKTLIFASTTNVRHLTVNICKFITQVHSTGSKKLGVFNVYNEIHNIAERVPEKRYINTIGQWRICM